MVKDVVRMAVILMVGTQAAVDKKSVSFYERTPRTRKLETGHATSILEKVRCTVGTLGPLGRSPTRRISPRNSRYP